jgi:hypothetical protein
MRSRKIGFLMIANIISVFHCETRSGGRRGISLRWGSEGQPVTRLGSKRWPFDKLELLSASANWVADRRPDDALGQLSRCLG